MNQFLRTFRPFSAVSFSFTRGISFPSQNLKLFLKSLLFLLITFLSSSPTFGQGINCAGATPIAINGTCLSATITNTVSSGPASTCGAAVREGWYTFTVSGGPTNITIEATADRNLAIQLLRSTASCTGLSEISCTNNVTGQGAGFGTETVTTVLANGIYYIKILNVGANVDMILQSLCVKICTSISNNFVTYSNGTSGQLSATAAENANAVLNASPVGTYFATVNFASYGTPGGIAPNFTYGTCHSATSQSVTEGLILGNTGSTSILASNGSYGDPCSGTAKSLYILASYAQTICSGANINITGSTPTGGNGTYSYQWQSSTTSATSGFGPAAGTNNGVNYTSGALTQDIWFRRVITSCTYSSTSAVVLVKVNPAPASTVVSGGGTFCGSTTITASGGTGGTIYFQGTTSGGTSITTASSSQSVTASGTYYFRSRSAAGCWGAEGSVLVNITPLVTGISGGPTPTNASSGICYSGTGVISNISWSSVTAATSYDVYFGPNSLPSSITANVTTNTYAVGTLLANTTYHWKIVPRNSCGITSGAPATWTFSTGSGPCLSAYCKPTTATPTNTYITDVRFLGTLNDTQNNNNGYSGGYQDFTGLANKTMQAAGEGVNVFVQSNGVDAVFKAWVDWNKDGLFDNTGPVTPTSELVFTSGGIRAISTTFGIVIPAGTAPGNYTIRIRNYVCLTGTCIGTNYTACENFAGTNFGEAEDYIITVIANCAANLTAVTPAVNCGPGTLTLSGTANAGTTTLRWYNAVTGGTMLAETPVNASFAASYTTPSISTTTTYYVTAYNGTCESIFRTPVVARIRPIPMISFNLPPASANFCGDDNTLKLTSAGEQEEINLIEENFDSGLGVFGVASGAGDTSTVTQTQWQNKGSIYTPVGAIWKPAISSGFGGNKFAFATSDYSTRTIHTIMTTTGSLDTTGFTTLKLNFSAFYSYYGDTSPAAGGTIEGLFVEVSTNGTVWTPVKTFSSSLGIGTLFSQQTIDLNAYRGFSNLKLRFRYIAYWGDGLALDNIKLYGDKPLTTSFVWTAPNIGIYNDDCVTNYVNGTPTSSVCIKPTQAQLETIPSWNISALATLSNGCTTTGVISVQNNNKVWDTNTSTNWQDVKWTPTSSVPDISKCVLIKQPVNILTGGNFEAKNVKVISGGMLTINKDSSLKIQDYLNNQSVAGAVQLESDGNLIQVNDGININTGSITAKKTMKISGPRKQYNYLMSPLEGQSLKTIYPGIDFVLYHNETNNYFYNSSGAYIKGRGLAVKEPNITAVPSTPSVTATYTGKPTNGSFTYNLINTAPAAVGTGTSVRGYNLIGNPYPSNIDMTQFYAINGGNTGTLSSTFYFWDSSVNDIYVQQGSNYGGQSYGQFNADSGLGTPATGDIGSTSLVTPTRYVKVGKAFMSRTVSANTSLLFNNSIRTNATPPLNSRNVEINENSGNHYSVSLVSSANIACTIAIGYFEGGSDALARDDSFSLLGSDALYSIVEDQYLSINGKNSFAVTDIVALGSTHFSAGNYRIMLKSQDGIFANGQNIYLKDKQTGFITDLTQGAYTFSANEGPSTGRFEIVYEPETVLATDGAKKENLLVYRDGKDFIVKAQNKKITHVEVFDGAGRLINALTPNNLKAVISSDQMINGVYILKISQNGEITSKKIIH